MSALATGTMPKFSVCMSPCFSSALAIQHYEVIVEEVSDTGAAPTIAIATCSPLVPSPTCILLNDYFRWHPDGKCKCCDFLIYATIVSSYSYDCPSNISCHLNVFLVTSDGNQMPKVSAVTCRYSTITSLYFD